MRNYRPIHILLSINKIFEKLIHFRINNFIQENNSISEKQYGFKNNSSAHLAIFDLVSSIVSSFTIKEYCVCIFIDLKKAFESVSHKILL